MIYKTVKFKNEYPLWSYFARLLDLEMDKVANFPENEDRDLLKTYWHRVKSDTKCLFVYDNNVPIGVLTYTEHHKYIDIRDFYILEDYRNQGIGTEMINKIKEIRNHRLIYVGTVGGNERALKLYQEFGFKILSYSLQM